MAAFDRADIRSRALARADQDASDFVSSALQNTFIDECARKVYGDLIAAGFPADFTVQTITANGAASYALNSGNPIYSVRAVYSAIAGDFQLMRRVSESDIGTLRSASSAGQPATFYDLRVSMTAGPLIEFLPTPASGTYRVEYIPQFTGFSNDADLWRGPVRSDELIVLCAAAKFLRKEGEVQDAAALDQEYQYLFESVMRDASTLFGRDPGRVRDVETSRRTDPFDYFAVGPDKGW